MSYEGCEQCGANITNEEQLHVCRSCWDAIERTTQPLVSMQTIRNAECERLSRWLDVLEKGIPFVDPRVAELVREMRERWLTLLRDDVREVST